MVINIILISIIIICFFIIKNYKKTIVNINNKHLIELKKLNKTNDKLIQDLHNYKGMIYQYESYIKQFNNKTTNKIFTLDDILIKINKIGIGNLTQDELNYLKNFKK